MQRQGILLLSAAMTACGGSVAGASDAGPDGAWDAPGSWSPVCPTTQPGVGSSCSGVMVACEYGHAWWDVSCDTGLGCTNGAWAPPPAASAPCVPAPGANAPACPQDPSTIRTSHPCPQDQLDCYYGMGTECSCGTSATQPDAAPIWACAPDTGCPSTRPRLGASCSANTQVCGYGLGSSSVGEQCINGFWQSAGSGGGISQ